MCAKRVATIQSLDQRIKLSVVGASFATQAIEDGLARFKLVDYIGTQAEDTHTERERETQTLTDTEREKERRCDTMKSAEVNFLGANTNVLGSHTNECASAQLTTCRC